MASKKEKFKGRDYRNQSNGAQNVANNNCIGSPLQYGPVPVMNTQHPQVFYPSVFSNSWQQFPNMNPSVQNNQHQNHKMCLLCKKEPKFTCARCGALYCSQECQKQDWQNHRFTCFAMPPLIPLKPSTGTSPSVSPLPIKSTRSSPPISPLPKNKGRVRLTGFRRPNLCYVRSLEPADNENFLKSTDIIYKYGSCAQHLNELPAPNTYAILLYEQHYHRVQILSAICNNEIRVLFIDKGLVKTVELADLRKITDHVVKILQHAVAIKLKGVENYILNENIENYLKQFCDREFTLEYNEDDDEKEFILNINSKNSLNKSISSFANKQENLYVYGELKLSSTEDDKPHLEELPISWRSDKNNPHNKNVRAEDDKENRKPVLMPPFEIVKLNEGDENMIIVVVNASHIGFGLFGCIVLKQKKTLDKIANYFKNYVDTGKTYEPQVDEYCIGQIGGIWCRIKILNTIDNTNYTVVNIDTTFTDQLKSNQIRRYPMDLTYPCSTVRCKIEGLLPMKGNHVIKNFMNSRFIVNSQHRITKVKKVVDETFHVQMDDLTDELILAFQNLQ